MIIPSLEFTEYNMPSNSFKCFNNTVITPIPERQKLRFRDWGTQSVVSFFDFSEYKKMLLKMGKLVGVKIHTETSGEEVRSGHGGQQSWLVSQDGAPP